MSTENIYGGWDSPRTDGSKEDEIFQWLWHRLAAQNVGLPAFQPNNGLSQRKHEIIELWKLFRTAKPMVVLEIGTAQGGTFASWCRLAPDNALIISIDKCIDDCRPRPGDPVHPEISSRPLKLTSQGGGAYSLSFGREVFAIEGWSFHQQVMAKLTRKLEGRKIDFLFHDASHSREMFAADFKLYWGLVADGGIFAAHDIMSSKADGCDKSIEWERIKKEENYSAVYEYFSSKESDSMGVGVLIK